MLYTYPSHKAERGKSMLFVLSLFQQVGSQALGALQ